MIIISHRGNLDGPNIFTENSPEQIYKVLKLGFSVEIDVHLTTVNFTDVFLNLGHDYGECYFKVDDFLERYDKYQIFIHAKTFNTYLFLKSILKHAYVFYHTNEAIVPIFNSHLFWLYPGKENELNFLINSISDCICVLPETWNKNIKQWANRKPWGICTDYPQRLKDSLNV